MNTKLVCRVCLDHERNKYISLYDKYKHYRLFEYINALTCIGIKYRDGLPDKICELCFGQLQTAIAFKEKCEASNVSLRNCTFKEELPYDNSSRNLKVKKEEFIDDDDDNDVDDVKTEEEPIDEHFNFSNLSDEDSANCKLPILLDPVIVPKSRAVDLKLECHDCGGIFKSKCKLRVHWKKVHMYENLICKDCKRTFKSYKAFNIHNNKKTRSCLVANDKRVSIEGVGRGRVFNCKECNYKTRKIKDMGTHLVIHSGERPFQCDLCPNTYTQYSSLQSHKEGAHKTYIMEITCHFCGKYIKGRRNVYRHLKRHTEQKVTCTICKKAMTKISYHLHMKRHTGVKSYTCEKCASTFYTSAELCNHKRWVHNKKENLFKCDLCDYKCAKSYTIKQHQIKHNDKNFPCTYCGRFYLNPEKLASHERTHYGEKKFSCPQCGSKFFNRDSVRKHMKQKHSLTIITEPKTVSIEPKKENAVVSLNEDVKVEIDAKL